MIKSIALPQHITIHSESDRVARIQIDGCHPGYGTTLGNAIRRVMLSSLPGAAVTTVKIANVQHEFSTMEGVLEDVIEISLNIKQLRFKMHNDEPMTVKLKAKGAKEIKGKDLKLPDGIELVSPDVHIATITNKSTELEMDMVVEKGYGYVPAEENNTEKLPIGTIAVDAVYTPIQMVKFEVEAMRIGERTDFNRLHMDIETDGSITPEEAFVQSADILAQHFIFLRDDLKPAEQLKKEAADAASEETIEEAPKAKTTKKSKKEAPGTLEDLKLSQKTINLLQDAGIKSVKGLTGRKEDSLNEIKGLGEKSVKEIKQTLGRHGLTLK